jgi:tight adherence protein B
MTLGLWIMLGLLFVLLLGVLALYLDVPLLGGLSSRLRDQEQMRGVLARQREVYSAEGKVFKPSLFSIVSNQKSHRKAVAKLSLKRKLRYAAWKMPVWMYWSLCIGLSAVAVFLVRIQLGILLQIVSLSFGFVLMGWFLERSIERRFKAFDADFPSFLLSVVSMVKTGLNPLGALEAAAQGLSDGSMVKAEVTLMMERLRFGVAEEKSIGSFAEDIAHPEIELFVQALILSRRVGGQLSATLERLAKQVRKRQFFRASAKASVAMQRGSIWFIIFIMVALELYIAYVNPEMVTAAFNHPTGKQVWQLGIFVILAGIKWVNSITKMKI